MKFPKKNSISIADEAGFLQMAKVLQGGNPEWNLFCWNLRHIFPDYTFHKVGGRLDHTRREEGVIHYLDKKVNDAYRAQGRGFDVSCAEYDDDCLRFHYNNQSRQGPVPDYYIAGVRYFPKEVAFRLALNSPEVTCMDVSVVDGKIQGITGYPATGNESIHPSRLNPAHYYSGGKCIFTEPFNVPKMRGLSPESRDQRVADLLERGLVLVDAERWEFI